MAGRKGSRADAKPGLASERLDPSITVAVRVRPMNQIERTKGCPPCAQVDASGSQLRLSHRDSALGTFAFDHVYDCDTTQHAIYEDLGRPLVKHAFRGQTCLLFAHGTTGSGKTHALTGSTLNPGISTRLFCEVFDALALLQRSNSDFRSRITVSYAEIYNEKVLDLLTTTKVASSREPELPATCEPSSVLNFDSTSEITVNSPEEMCKWKEQGDQYRKTKSHRLSCCSASLSHTIFSIHIRHSTHTHASLRNEPAGHIHIVDLASSNVLDRLDCNWVGEEKPTRQMVYAAARVDQSLTAVCAALHSAASRDMTGGDAYCEANLGMGSDEDSMLTRILKSQQWYECRCVVLACISPTHTAMKESLKTLEFASTCYGISHPHKYAMHSANTQLHTGAAPINACVKIPNTAVVLYEKEGDAVIPNTQEGMLRTELVARFKTIMQQHQALVQEITQLNHQISAAPAASSTCPTSNTAATVAAASVSAISHVSGRMGGGAGGVAEVERRRVGKQEHLLHLTAVLERERQTVKRSWELGVRAASDTQPLHQNLQSTLAKMKLSEILDAALPMGLKSSSCAALLELLPLLESQLSETRIALNTTKTVAASQRTGLLKQIHSLSPSTFHAHCSHHHTASSTPAQTSVTRTLQVACKRAGELVQSWSVLGTLRGRALETSEKLHVLLTDILDQIIVQTSESEGSLDDIGNALSAIDDVEYARSRVANLRARMTWEDVQTLDLTPQHLEQVHLSLAHLSASKSSAGAGAAVMSRYGEAGGVLALERMVSVALEEHTRSTQMEEAEERKQHMAALAQQLTAAQHQCLRERQQCEALNESLEGIKVVLKELVQQHQSVLPQVQRQLDGLARRRSLEHHEHMQQKNEHEKDKIEWKLQMQTLAENLEELQGELACARSDVRAANSKLSAAVAQNQKLQQASAAAASSAHIKNKQLQGMLGLCRKARACELAPDALAPDALAADALAPDRQQHTRLQSLEQQLATVEQTLELTANSLQSHMREISSSSSLLKRTRVEQQAISQARHHHQMASPRIHAQHSKHVPRVTVDVAPLSAQHSLFEPTHCPPPPPPAGELGGGRDLPVFERVLEAAGNVSLEQLKLLSFERYHPIPFDTWAACERGLAREMRVLLECIVAASNETSTIHHSLIIARERVRHLEKQFRDARRALHRPPAALMPPSHHSAASNKTMYSCNATVIAPATPTPSSKHDKSTDGGGGGEGDGKQKRQRDHANEQVDEEERREEERREEARREEEMAIKVLTARAAAQNEKAKRKALERKMRAYTRLTPTRHTYTHSPKTSTSSTYASAAVSCGNAHTAKVSCSIASVHTRQTRHAACPSVASAARLESARDCKHSTTDTTGGTQAMLTGGRQTVDRNGWRPKLTKQLHTQTQTTFATAPAATACAQVGEWQVGTTKSLLWHIELPPLFLIHSLWASDAGELISSRRLLPWDAFLASKYIRHGPECLDLQVVSCGAVSWQLLQEKDTRQALGAYEVLRRECMAGRKYISDMTSKKQEMDEELDHLRDIVSTLSEKMESWRLRHEILATQRDRAEATIQHLW